MSQSEAVRGVCDRTPGQKANDHQHTNQYPDKHQDTVDIVHAEHQELFFFKFILKLPTNLFSYHMPVSNNQADTHTQNIQGYRIVPHGSHA